MKKKKCYTILSKAKRHLYGCFDRTKEGLLIAKKYKIKLEKDTGIQFIIK